MSQNSDSTSARTVKVDLHVHSEASNRPPQWFFRKMQTGECYTDPRRLYDIATARGMDLVTITDHDSIAGVSEIAHLSNVFVSEEISAIFPENRAVIHVLAYCVTEAQHHEIQRLRQNVYELVRYLRKENIAHVVAHPLSPPDGRLTSGQVEKMLLLFPNFELVNGTRDPMHVALWQEVLGSLNRERLAEMAERHGIEPVSWDLQWGFTAGSDDHGMIAIARAHTEFEGPRTVEGFLEALRERRTRVAGHNGTPIALGHNIYSVSLGYVRHRDRNEVGGGGNPFRSILESTVASAVQTPVVTPPPEPARSSISVAMGGAAVVSPRANGSTHSYMANGHANGHSHGYANGNGQSHAHLHVHEHGDARGLDEARRFVPWMKPGAEAAPAATPAPLPVAQARVSERIGRTLVEDFKKAPWFSLATLLTRGHTEGFEEEIFATANQSLNRIARTYVQEFIGATGQFDIDRMAGVVPEMLSLGFLLLPYYLSFRWFGHDNQRAVRLATPILGTVPTLGHGQVAVFTDVFDTVDGVSTSLRGTVTAARAQGRNIAVLTCADGERTSPYENRFAPIASFPIPDYESIRIGIPPLLEILKYCTDNKVSILHAATPGPMGIAALLVGEILDLPVVGQYHTNLPAQAKRLANDHNIEKAVGTILAWFYGHCDRTVVHSVAAADDLAHWGVPRDKLVLATQGIDLDRFTQAPRDPAVYQALGVPADAIKVLYVGRLAREKSIDVLLSAWHQRSEAMRSARLILVGDGPIRPELEALRGDDETVIFAGERQGDELARLYASADVFVLPSSADTFGLVVLEAQAAGLPVIVTDQGGPRELVVPGRTGLVVAYGDAAALARALDELIRDPLRRQEMGRRAQAHVADFSFDRAVEELFAAYPKLPFRPAKPATT